MTALMGTRRHAYEVLRKWATDEAGDSLAEAVAAVLPWWYLDRYLDRLATDDGFREALGLAALELPGLGEVGRTEAYAAAKAILRALKDCPEDVLAWILLFGGKYLSARGDRVEVGSKIHPGFEVSLSLVGGEIATVYVVVGGALGLESGEVGGKVAHLIGAAARTVLAIALEGGREE
ncbi:hypothetical protein phiKo_26 [Thermus phage phiKo]|nr:hypothetical protein phiKo_26 [Thermus phage phiKo]